MSRLLGAVMALFALYLWVLGLHEFIDGDPVGGVAMLLCAVLGGVGAVAVWRDGA